MPNPVTLTGLDEKFAAKKVAIFHPSFVLIFLVVKARAKFDPSFEGGDIEPRKKGAKKLAPISLLVSDDRKTFILGFCRPGTH